MLRLDTSVGGLEFFSPCCLAGKKKCLRILALSAEFERAEIFEPATFGLVSSQTRRRFRSSRPTSQPCMRSTR